MEYKKIVWVFGSNLAGVHGAGAARFAMDNYGAVFGEGSGLCCSARRAAGPELVIPYALPTKDENIKTMPLEDIRPYVEGLIVDAEAAHNWLFYITAFGQGLAGYTKEDILPLFGDLDKLPYNMVFTREWLK